MTDGRPGGGEYIQREASLVRVFTPSGIIDGLYHHVPGVRLSDSLRNATTERYMLLTGVSIRGLDGGTIEGDAATASFILINTQHASVIVPLEEQHADSHAA